MNNQLIRNENKSKAIKIYRNTTALIVLVIGSLACFSVRAVPPEFEVKVNNFPAVQDVEVTNLPSVMDVNVIADSTLQISGSVTTGTDSGGGNSKTVFMFAYVLNDLGTNYGSVPDGKKLVITDIIARHGVNTTVGVTNFLLYSQAASEGCGAGTKRTVWSMLVPEGVSVATNLTTGIEIPEGNIMCAGSTNSTSVSAHLVAYITDM